MKTYWSLLCQTVTIFVGFFLVTSIFKPDWINPQFNLHSLNRETSKIATLAPKDRGIQSYATAVTKAQPSVVSIVTMHKMKKQYQEMQLPHSFFEPFFNEKEEKQEGLGSGVIISNDGLILTNHHVIKGADSIEISLFDGRKSSAVVIGGDPESDIALIKTSLTNLQSITFSDENKTQVGDVVLALGNPFGVGQTVTMGIISAMSRKGLGINTFENFLQTDAAINPGNSGGALVDSNGHLLGINTAIFSKSGGNMGIGFAIPVSLTQKIWPQLLKTGQVQRGYIGIEGISLNEQVNEELQLQNQLSIDKKQKGILVRAIAKGAAADLGGVKTGDIIVKINNKNVTEMNELLNIVAAMKPHDKVQIFVIREGQELQLQLKIMSRPIPK